MRPVFELGKVLMKIVLRCKFNGDTLSNITDASMLIYNMGVDEFEARSATRKIDEIGDKISASCKIILDSFQITDEQRDRIIGSLVETYQKADISIDDFFEDYSTEDLLFRKLIANNQTYKDNLDQKESELYERLLRHSSALLFQAYYEIPEFQAIGIKHLNSKMDGVKKNIDFIIKELEKVNFGKKENSKESDYEKIYMRNIINRLNHVYLFGVNNMERALKRYKLSIAYVSLELSHQDEVFDLDRLLEKKQNIWIIGEAGAGKTTLLQWVAVQYAKEYIDKLIVPIYVELRNMQQGFSLRKCINSIMEDSFYDMPQGWIEKKIQSGKAVFLIDGFDEIAIEKREAIFNKIEEIDPENRCKRVYTSRPQITQRPHDRNLIDVVIKPMNKNTIMKFLKYWHKAVLEDQLQISGEETERTVNKLYSKMEGNSSIIKLASSPLLCAMICALHYKNEMNLPINRRQLYDECCKLLIENRDIEKGVKPSIKLSYEQKEVILSQLAYWMMINRYNDIDKLTASTKVQEFASSMVFLNQDSAYNRVFPYLLERCGILREPEKNRIDFIHRSFEEYLAAIEIRRQNNWGFLESVAVDDMWKETVEIAIGFANIEKASSIIRAVFNKSKSRRRDKKYLFLAFSYYNNAIQVDYKTTEQIKHSIQNMIPPKKAQIENLINTGDVVVEFLKLEQGGKYEPEVFVNSLKVLRGIGTKKALEMANTYLKFDLPIEALKEYGMMLEDFSNRELMECETPKQIEQYIYTYYSHSMTLHEGMLKALLLAEDGVVGRIEKTIDWNLTIIGYTDKIDLSRLFNRGLVSRLSFYGDFVTCSQMDLFPKVNDLTICSTNDGELHISLKNGYCKLSNLEVILNSKVGVLNLSAFDVNNSITVINMNAEINYDTVVQIMSCSNLRIGGGFLYSKIRTMSQEYKGKITLLLNKRLYNEYRDVKNSHEVEFENIDVILDFYKRESGGIVQYKSFNQAKGDVADFLSDYLKIPAYEVNEYLSNTRKDCEPKCLPAPTLLKPSRSHRYGSGKNNES